MSAGLTKRQAECLAAIKRLATPEGVAPSLVEIGAALGTTSRSNVHALVSILIERGHLRRKPGRARSIEIIGSCPDPALQALAMALDRAKPDWHGCVTITLSKGLTTALRRALPKPMGGVAP